MNRPELNRRLKIHSAHPYMLADGIPSVLAIRVTLPENPNSGVGSIKNTQLANTERRFANLKTDPLLVQSTTLDSPCKDRLLRDENKAKAAGIPLHEMELPQQANSRTSGDQSGDIPYERMRVTAASRLDCMDAILMPNS